MLKTWMLGLMLTTTTMAVEAHADGAKDLGSFFFGKKKAAPSAAAQGNWLVHQTNANGAVYTGSLVLTQHGDRVAGRAEWDNHVVGSVTGRVVNGRLEIAVTYPGALVGYYAADLSGNQLVNGQCQDNKGSKPCAWTARK